MVFLLSCNQENQSNENLLISTLDTVEVENRISDEALIDIIKSIPSPLEISALIKESGVEYNRDMLNPSQNSSNYTSNYKRSLNLGIYGADLGYINLYSQNKDAISYLSSIKNLADELSIGQFYDFETIKRLASNSSNIDSLLYITTSNFEKINNFLYKNRRSDQSVLLLTGGWLEALHISCQIAAKNKELYEKIGEQKIVLDQILLLVSNFRNQSNMQALAKELHSLKKVYDKVQIIYTYEESTMEEVDGILVIQDNSESKVHISEEQVKEISRLTESIRNRIINSL